MLIYALGYEYKFSIEVMYDIQLAANSLPNYIKEFEIEDIYNPHDNDNVLFNYINYPKIIPYIYYQNGSQRNKLCCIH
jgi:hypothetical protein